MTLSAPPERPSKPPSELGFSLIEVLVASLLLLVIALGLIPLFTRAMLDNANGRDATTATNADRSQLETLNPIPFDFDVKTLPAGQEYREINESYSRGTLGVDNDSTEGWQAGIPSNLSTIRWTRRTRIRQYQAIDLKDLDGHGDPANPKPGILDHPLSGGTDDAFVQLKEVEVTVQGANRSLTNIGNLLGGGPEVTFRKLTAY